MNKKISVWDVVAKSKMSLKDMKLLYSGVKTLKNLKKDKAPIFNDLFRNVVDKYPDNEFLVYDGKSMTYKDADNLTNKLARSFFDKGIVQGDTVSLIADNCAEYLIVLIAGIKAGLIVSLVNNNLRGESLRHCIETTGSSHVILSERLIDTFKNEFKESMDGRIFYINQNYINLSSQNDVKNTEYLFNNVFSYSDELVYTKTELDDAIFYLFTSGSTGLPKAALVTNRRYIIGYAGYGLSLARLKPEDRFYVYLPFFHGNSTVVSLNAVLASGATLIVGEKFSKSKFWETIIETKATAFSYIGEICRYLLTNPPSELEKKHSVEKVFGNGLKPELWDEFQDRFGIPKIGEFYAASESPIGFMNVFYMKHTVGFTTLPYKVIKFNFDEDKPYRNKKGFFETVKKGEVGLLIAPKDKNFAGYSDPKKNEDLFLKDAFQKGDVWINTGDMVREMGFNHLQFAERSGDSYRWKGENTSAVEVENIIDSINGVEKSAVFGVQLDKYDGKAGLAAVVFKNEDAIKDIYQHLKDNIQEASMPVFVRSVYSFEMTETHKIKKVNLKKMGWEGDVENVYIIDHAQKEYRKITQEDINEIKKGEKKI